MEDRLWTFAPIDPSGAVVRTCLVLERRAADGPPSPVTIDETLDAIGLLGALTDARSHPVRWVVLWLAKAPKASLGGDGLDLPASNGEILRRWRHAWRPWDRPCSEGGCLVFPGEEDRGPVLLLDPDGGDPRPLSFGRDPTPLELCTDDSLLAGNELPAYASTTHRFLVARPPHGNPRFAWLSGPSQPDGTLAVTEAVGGSDQRVLFNAGADLLGAGPVRITPFQPVGYTDLAALLHGEALRSALRFGATSPSERASLEAACSPLLEEWGKLAEIRTPPLEAGRLFGTGDPQGLRELEACYLRLRAITDLVSSVRDAVSRSGQPLFNVSTESFSVDGGSPADGCPFLWQTQVRLSRPGVARTFTVESDPPLRLFARPPSAGLDSLVPVQEASAFLAECLILDVADAGPNRVALKLQIVPRQTVAVNDTDLLRLTLRVGEHLVPVLARPLRSMAGRQPFEARSLPLVPPDARTIRAGASVTLPVETIPLEGTPHDLYALFILACRMLLAGGQPSGGSRHEANEEAQTLARLRLTLGVDDAVQEAKGPLFPSPESVDPLVRPAPLRASDGLPAQWPEGISTEIWSDILRAIGSMRPGWPGCPARDFADFDPELPARVFDAPLASLESICRRLRSQLLGERAIDADIRLAALELLGER